MTTFSQGFLSGWIFLDFGAVQHGLYPHPSPPLGQLTQQPTYSLLSRILLQPLPDPSTLYPFPRFPTGRPLPTQSA